MSGMLVSGVSGAIVEYCVIYSNAGGGTRKRKAIENAVSIQLSS